MLNCPYYGSGKQDITKLKQLISTFDEVIFKNFIFKNSKNFKKVNNLTNKINYMKLDLLKYKLLRIRMIF